MTPHRQNPETPIMSDKSDNISDKSLHGSAALLPCPFCGSTEDAPLEEVVHVSMSEHDWRNPSWTVQCDNCTATMGSSDTEEEAIDAWNTRTIARQALRADIIDRFENTLRSLDDDKRAAALSDLAALDGETM